MQKRSQHDVKKCFSGSQIFLNGVDRSFIYNYQCVFLYNQSVYSELEYVIASNFISLLMRIDFAVQI